MFRVRTGTCFVALGLIAVLGSAAQAQVVPRWVRNQFTAAPTGAPVLAEPLVQEELPLDRIATEDPNSIVRALTSDRLANGGLDLELAARTGTRQVESLPVASLGGCPCPPGANDEGEICGDNDNEGCSAGFCGQGGFVDVASGETWCGTAWADGGVRDLDYYRITLLEVSTLTTTTTSAFPSTTFVAEDVAGDCSSFIILDTYNEDGCVGASNSITLRPGTYYVALGTGDVDGPIFGGFPCGSGSNEYSISFDVVSADCLTSAVTEAEACGTDANGGCDPTGAGPSAFETIALGATVTGQTSTDAGADVDYYEFTIATTSEVTVTVDSEVPTLFAISTSNCVDDGTGVFGEEFVCDANTNEGGCSGPTTATAILGAGTYWVQIGAGDALGYYIDGVSCVDPGNNYELTVTSAIPTGACALTPTGVAELEACGDDVNGGCNLTGVEFEPIDPQFVGSSFSGTGSAYADCGLRDTDWWQFEATEDMSLTIDLTSQGNMTALLLPLDCGGLFIVAEANSVDCATGSTTLNIATGEYILLILPDDGTAGIFDGQPCGYRDLYNFTLTAGPVVTGGCPVTCAATFTEGEACGDMINDGCALAVPAFEDLGLDPAETVSGTVFADGNRNFDVYHFDVSQASEITVTITSNLPVGVTLVEEACALGGYLPIECDFAFSAGDCVPVTGTTATFPVTPTVGVRYALIVTVGGEPFGGCGMVGSAIFSGFPCSGGANDYCMDVSVGTPGCFFPSGTVAANCATGELDFDLVASADYNDIFWEAADQGGVIVSSGTINGPIASGAAITESFDISALSPGILDVTVTANCANGEESVGVAVTGYFPYNDEDDVIVRGENFDGCIDSANDLEAALIANGRSVLTIDLVDGDGVGAFDFSGWECGTTLDSDNNIFVSLGSFPNNSGLLAAEGQALVDYMTLQSVDIYLAGGDIWGFDALTPIADFDGVAGRVVDGNILP
ncbi:MAG: hypothetical protein AAF488_06125, partial [Planctomycetota bacterium]